MTEGVEGTVLLRGVVDISAARGLYEDLQHRLDLGGPVILDGGQLERVDGAVLQLLAALFLSGRKSGVDCAWSGVSEELSNTARLLGLEAALSLNAA